LACNGAIALRFEFLMFSRRMLWPALAGLPVLIILLGLGTWQAQRLVWKTELLARIAAAEAAAPAPFNDPPVPYAKLEAVGRFDHAREALLGVEIRANRMGARLIVPFLRDSGPPMLVDRGWVPMDGLAGLPRPEGLQRITGYIRFGEAAGRLACPVRRPMRWCCLAPQAACQSRHRPCHGRGTTTLAMPLPGMAWRYP
jgi:cytochrome oxidase assembly protein ShyY1